MSLGSDIMKTIEYLKKNGIKRFFKVLWQYKIEIVLEKFIYIFTKNKPLQDKILIESHNDFDCNGGAFYNYLIEHGYNKKYKIVWLVRKKVKEKLPMNVKTVPLLGPSLKKAYHICTAKYVTFDCESVNKLRKDQKVVYCSHGAGGLKNAKGKMFIPNSVDYILVQSKEYAPIQANQWSLNWPDKRIVFIGYPAQDTFFIDDRSELLKITSKKYKKVILWMPTFRKSLVNNRNDSLKEQKLGIPLINTSEEYHKLNKQLKKEDVYLIIKLHPKQDVSNLGIEDMSNIKVLTGLLVKELEIDNYKLMKCTDALISDYSGAAYEYLQLNRPLGYVLDDMNEYKLGFVVDDIHQLIARHEIYTLKDLENFITDVVNEKDVYKKKREELRDYIYEYHDGKASERLVKLLGINLD